MNDRLSALDVSFLYLEGRVHAHARGRTGRASTCPPGGFDYERFVEPDRGPDLAGPAVPAEDQVGARPHRLPGVGRRHRVRRQLPRPSVGAAAAGLRRAVARPGGPAAVPAAGPVAAVVGDEHRRGPGRRRVRDHHQDPPRDGRRHQRGRHRPGHPRRDPDAARDRARRTGGRGPSRAPVDLVVDAVRDLVSRPGAVARHGADGRRTTCGPPPGRLVGTVGGLVSAARVAARRHHRARSTCRSARSGGSRSPARRSPTTRRCAAHVQGTVNDVVLATVAGALRGWLLARGQAVTPTTTVRAMVPLSVRTEVRPAQLGNRVSSYLVDLPVGEPNPLVRLTQISYAMAAHKESGQSVGADALIALSGFAPPTLHALGRPGREQLHAPAVQPGRHQRARAAVPVVRRRGRACGRCSRSCRWRRGRRSRSG